MNRFHDTASPIETIFQTVGAASRCWAEESGKGVFDEQKAIGVANDCIDRLKEQGVTFP